MEKTFAVGPITYVIGYQGRSFYLYIDTMQSADKRLYVVDKLGAGFGDVTPEKLYDRTPCHNVFRVKAEALDFLEKVLRRYRPSMFMLSANEQEKTSLYERIARRLATRHGYYLSTEGRVFVFYKLR